MGQEQKLYMVKDEKTGKMRPAQPGDKIFDQKKKSTASDTLTVQENMKKNPLGALAAKAKAARKRSVVDEDVAEGEAKRQKDKKKNRDY